MKEKITIGIAGNPNSGKTTLFNALTGGKQRVGNWPGVTVEKKVGGYTSAGKQIEVVDLPGIYSLSTSSLDEEIARDFILREKPDLIVNILDAANLERNLYLSTQLIGMKVPLVLVLNMMDLARTKRLRIEAAALARLLDVPVIATVASKREGIEDLKRAVDRALEKRAVSSVEIYYPREVEEAISELVPLLPGKRGEMDYDPRWLAVKLLEGDIDPGKFPISSPARAKLEDQRKSIAGIQGEDPDIVIADSRYGFINAVCRKVVDRKDVVRRTTSDLIDKVVLNRFLGIPIFLMAMYFTFWITVNFGGCFIDFFDGFAGTIFVDGLGSLLGNIGAPEFIIALLAGGIGGGIQTVATFIPPIFFIFFCLAILEDSGYMARAAFVMDRLMRAVGLPGKSFVPMLIGFGCNVPAIMATRTLESEKDRVITIMMNPFMSCGARMPVYALFAAAFFPGAGSWIVLSLYLVGIILAILTGVLLHRTILKGRPSTFIMELPPYHIPTVRGILFHAWERLKVFILRAGKVILLVVMVLSFLNSIGPDGSFGNEDSDNSVLSLIGRSIVPVFKPMGLKESNWPAAVGIFTGIFAKEAVIGTLDSLYSRFDPEESGEEESGFDFWGGIAESFATIPAGISQLSLPFSVSGLLGAEVEEFGSLDEAAESLEVGLSTPQTLRKHFDGKAGAYAYLLMILLYMPCVAAIAAVYRELNWQWTLFSALYLSALAWLGSTFFYQLARFGRHPGSSLGWIALVTAVLAVFVLGMKKKAARQGVLQ
jgi:ferrous iron transport protein B